jgi:hypothetical protein
MKPVLQSFALAVWGSSSSWFWAERPKGCLVPYAWIGIVSQIEGCRSSEPLGDNSRFGVILEDVNSFRVLAFQEYIYQQLTHNYGTAISSLYMCRIEVSLSSEKKDADVKENLRKLHQYLANNPVSFSTSEYDRPPMELDQEVDFGIRLTVKVLNRWLPPLM